MRSEVPGSAPRLQPPPRRSSMTWRRRQVWAVGLEASSLGTSQAAEAAPPPPPPPLPPPLPPPEMPPEKTKKEKKQEPQ